MKCLNNDKREELGWKTSFQVYYGRENNETLRASLPINEEIDISRVKSVKKRDYNYFVKKTIKIRRKALQASKPIDRRTIQRDERLNKCSVYSPGETVLLRMGEKRSKFRSNIKILEGKVIKNSKTLDRYLVQFNHPKEKQPSKMWFSVEDMADYVKDKVAADKNKTTKLENLRKKLLMPLTREDRLDAITNQEYAIIYDPPGNGDCHLQL